MAGHFVSIYQLNAVSVFFSLILLDLFFLLANTLSPCLSALLPWVHPDPVWWKRVAQEVHQHSEVHVLENVFMEMFFHLVRFYLYCSQTLSKLTDMTLFSVSLMLYSAVLLQKNIIWALESLSLCVSLPPPSLSCHHSLPPYLLPLIGALCHQSGLLGCVVMLWLFCY